MMTDTRKQKNSPPRRVLLAILSLLPSAAILLLQPLSMTVPQSASAALLVLAVLWWVTKLVERTVASAVLLVGFCLFSGVPAAQVFTFPLSETFVLIVLSFLFSEGVKNSGLADKLLLPLLSRWATTPVRTLASILIVDLLMIFIIPQPFSRVILVALIYDRFFRQAGMEDSLRRVLLLLVHVSSILVNMCLLRGDLILNHALLTISGASIGEGEWLRFMAIPSLIWAILSAAASLLIFRRQFALFPSIRPQPVSPWTKREKRDLVILALILVLWATEGLHHISGTLIVLAGTAAMVPLGLLKKKDLRCLDIRLLVFLTAVFSIGSVMKSNGTAQAIFSRFTALFPSVFSLWYLLLILCITMVMHMILGSSITTMSVVVPSLMVICQGMVSTPVLLFSIYIIASAHCLLPLHNVITMIGEGKEMFSARDLTRYGAIMTIPTLLAVMTLFFGWWHVLGVL